ncbi:uncharacterized protein LOC21412626 [Morus notabilis]|uniref:uncharacterized protein LOC21412626 n=1 Tax=Morus notabilis TaxID=981085 RepID=UPI000CED619A|nr:uncharacterized protein LOC21412626 [Morus notabilis]
MLDPLPSVAKIFNLVVQEERQQTIGAVVASQPSESMAFNVASPTPSTAVVGSHTRPRRERLLCTHCGLQGHTVEKCFRLHGFPPGYRSKPIRAQQPNRVQQAQSYLQSNASGLRANQTSLQTYESPFSPAPPTATPGSSQFTEQCQQLIALLSSQLHLRKPSVTSTEEQLPGPSVSNFIGPFSGIDDWEG